MINEEHQHVEQGSRVLRLFSEREHRIYGTSDVSVTFAYKCHVQVSTYPMTKPT